jgi:hypothetical protein
MHGVVVAGHRRRRARDPVRELGHSRFRDDDRTGVPQVLSHRCLIRRNQSGESQGTTGCRHVGRVDVVLQSDRDAVQRSANPSLRSLAIERFRFLQSLRIDDHHRVELVFVRGDAREMQERELSRCHAALSHRALHLGDGRLAHDELTLTLSGKQQGGKRKHLHAAKCINRRAMERRRGRGAPRDT